MSYDKPLIDLTFSGPCVVILEIGCSCKDLNVLAGRLLVSDNQLALSRLSLRAGGRGFSLATNRVAPGYFYWKIEEK